MAIPTTRYERLSAVLSEHTMIGSKTTTYIVTHIDEICIVFSENNSTKKVMIPTDVALEWISAYEFGLINTKMSSREMREIVKKKSDWAAHIHAFETHLSAIVRAWAQSDI